MVLISTKKISAKQFKVVQGHSIDIICKRILHNKRTALEKKFEEIATKLNLPYKFVGNGEFFVERKNPDFINTNHEKTAVEVYYRKHKEHFKDMSIDDWKRNRQDIFSHYGWTIEFFDETQVNEDEVRSRLSK